MPAGGVVNQEPVFRERTVTPGISGFARVPGQERFDPPDDMPEDQKVIWRRIMSACPAGWFGGENLHLLRLLSFHQAHADALSVAIAADPERAAALTEQMLKHTNMVMRLSHQLRLTQKSRYEGRKPADPAQQHARRPWDM